MKLRPVHLIGAVTLALGAVGLLFATMSANAASPAASSVTWTDNFSSTSLDSRWSWVREDPTHWSLAARPGFLRLTTQQTSWSGNNLLVQNAPGGGYEIQLIDDSNRLFLPLILKLSPFRDGFNGTLAEGWRWVNENPGKWNLTEQPGFLRIYASHYAAGGENLLLRSVAQGDFTIKTHVFFEPHTNFQGAGLVIYQDDSNLLSLGRAFCDTPYVCVGNGIYFDYFGGGTWVGGNFGTSVGSPSEAYLRLERRGQMVKASYSYEGVTWFEIGTHWIPSDFQVTGVGLMAAGDYNTSDSDIPADFDFFELTENQ
jgi:beta-xylosidase